LEWTRIDFNFVDLPRHLTRARGWMISVARPKQTSCLGSIPLISVQKHLNTHSFSCGFSYYPTNAIVAHRSSLVLSNMVHHDPPNFRTSIYLIWWIDADLVPVGGAVGDSDMFTLVRITHENPSGYASRLCHAGRLGRTGNFVRESCGESNSSSLGTTSIFWFFF
jgi:hypothetical protein